jgi:tetratricopeptide (TPR) repeat protein
MRGLVCLCVVAAAPAAAAEELVAGATVEGRLGGGVPVEHRLVMAAGEAVALEAVQDGIDLVLAIHGPGGSGEIDSPTGTQGTESLRFVAERGGAHTVTVRALEPEAPAGRYALRVVWRRKALPRDRDIVEAQRRTARAWALREELRFARALPHAERALALLTRLHGPSSVEVAGALELRGYLRDEIGDYAGGARDFARVVAILEQRLGPEARETLNQKSNLAFLRLAEGDLATARRLFEENLAARERAGLRIDDQVQGLGSTLRELGELDAAETAMRRAVSLRDARAGRRLDAARGSLGAVLVELGQLEEGETLCAAAAQALGELRGFARLGALSARQCVAEARLARGDVAAARHALEGVVAARREILGPRHPFVGAALIPLGRAVLAGGDADAARRTLARAVSIAERTFHRPHPQLASALVALAAVERAAGNGAKERALVARARRILERAGAARAARELGYAEP